jgi:hypothetical protein
MKVYLIALIPALSLSSCFVAPPPPGTLGGAIPPPPYYYRDAPVNQQGQGAPANGATAQNQPGPTTPPAVNTTPATPTAPTTPAPSNSSSGAELTPLPKQDYPMGETTGNPNRVISPYKPYNVIDVTGFKSGALAKDPSNGKIFRVP